MNHQNEQSYEFDSFLLNPLKRVLLRDGEVVPLTSKAFDTLLILVERRGQVLKKDELMSALWPDTIVEENNLTQHISMLRKALGERAGEHRYVVTVPGRGYSFVADVSDVRQDDSDLILQQRTRSSIAIEIEEEQSEETSLAQTGEPKQLQATVTTRRRPRRKIGALVIAVALTVSLAGIASTFGYFWGARTSRQQAEASVTKTIAVLPFRTLNSSSDEDFLGTGMTDTLIAKLSTIRQISVRPTSSVMKYAGTNPDTLAAGRELGVDSVLEGTIQRAGERMRVTVQLISVRDGQSLWAQTFDERLTDIFVMQDDISEHVAQEMLVKLTGEERERLKKRSTDNIEAYQAYLRGRYFWNKRDENGLRKGIQYFQQATEMDHAYALAYAGIADAYSVMVGYGLAAPSPEESFRKAKVAALKALEYDDELAEAHTSLASIHIYYDHDFSSGESEFKRAIELNPNYATAHHWYSEYLAMVGRQDEAMLEIKRAQELDPLSPIINTTLGERLFYARQYEEAISQLLKTLEIDPEFFLARYVLALAYEQKGMYKEAGEELEKVKEASGNRPRFVAALAHVYAVSGRKDQAHKILNRLLKAEPEMPYEIATVYAGLGEKAQALEWLQKRPDDPHVGMIKTDPRWDSFRVDPNFRPLF